MIDPKLQEEASKVFEKAGIDMSQAVLSVYYEWKDTILYRDAP